MGKETVLRPLAVAATPPCSAVTIGVGAAKNAVPLADDDVPPETLPPTPFVPKKFFFD